ncbi:MAG: L,D-transpeptidase family protein [Beijerinckiaceae bacterium]|jgi:murein L,D-transpeptidase YcbB/YkuD|nr:L,D-transpeptidase family protein [Beijerinckiaceae bacterium]
MAVRRVTLSASLLALCAAFPALIAQASASEENAFPAPPEAIGLVLTPADLGQERIAPRNGPDELAPLLTVQLSDAEIERNFPAPPEPLPLVLDIAVENPAKDLASAPADAAPEPRLADSGPMLTATIRPAEPVTDEAAPGLSPLTAATPGDAPAATPNETLPETPAIVVGPEIPAPPYPAIVILDEPVAPPAAEPPQPVIAAPMVPDEISPLLAARLAEAVARPWLPERDERAIVAFYEARGHKPMWHAAGGLTEAGQRLRDQLARAAEDGLRPEDYATPRLINPRPLDLALADIRLTTLAVRYARDARGGRIDPRRLSALITPKLDLPAAGDVLARLDGHAEPDSVLASYQPNHEGYRALKAKLADLRQSLPQVQPSVRIPPAGPAIRIGMRDDRITLIRARFGFAPEDGRMHDAGLATVVAGFQRENGLPANGVISRATIEAMNGGATSARVADLIANMERWRWLPGDLGSEHLIVNVPEYMVRKVENGEVIHSSRVVVGKAERPTPIFSDLMDHLVLNPSWTIPPTIMRQDILPKLAADPGYAERRGFQVIRRGNNITVRQPPGPSNALGNIKFMFPNDHAVYLHDTPSRNLFASARRAYSSGCVRVERPLKLAELVLAGTDGGWSERRLQSLVGSGERTIRLTRKLPIHIVYMTQVVDADGTLRSFEDIYGFHRRTREALGL